MANTMRKVLIHGYYGAGNLGDDAILEAMIEEISHLPGVGSIAVSAYGARPVYSGPYPVHTVAGRDPSALYDAVQACDVLVIGGGGLLHDYHGLAVDDLIGQPPRALAARSALGYYGLPLAMARFLGRPVMLYAVGVGPFRTAEGARLAGWLAQSATAVTVRDRVSREMLREQGARKVVVTADPAVSLRPKATTNGTITQSLPPRNSAGRLTVGINLRPWSYGADEYIVPVAETARWLAADLGAGVVSVPLSVSPAELRLARRVQRFLPAGEVGKAGTVVVPKTPTELLEICGRLDLVIAMRLHASVLSMVAGTPAVGLAYDPKVLRFYEEAGMPELCLDPAQLTPDRLRATVERVLADLPTWQARVRRSIAQLRQQEQQNGAILVRLIERGPSAREDRS